MLNQHLSPSSSPPPSSQCVRSFHGWHVATESVDTRPTFTMVTRHVVLADAGVGGSILTMSLPHPTTSPPLLPHLPPPPSPPPTPALTGQLSLPPLSPCLSLVRLYLTPPPLPPHLTPLTGQLLASHSVRP